MPLYARRRPCLSKDLTTHAVPPFKQALQMGRRDAVRGSDNGQGREAQMRRRDAVRGSDNGRGREARQGLQPGDVRSSLRRGALDEGAEAIFTSARVGVGVGAEACSSINFGRPGALLGSSVAFGSGCG